MDGLIEAGSTPEARMPMVARLYVRGSSIRKIATQLGLSHGTIGNDLKAIREAWRDSSIRDWDAHRELELQKLDELESEAWEGWERSKQDAVTVKETPRGTETTTKRQAGDPRFLEVIKGCIVRRSALLGLDAPKKMIPLTPSGEPAQSYRQAFANLTPAELRALSKLYRKTQNLEHENTVEGKIVRSDNDIGGNGNPP
jgi:transposase